jgi:hypothetical protein
MLSRALSIAAVALLVGCFATPPVWAQAQNLEAGKSPSQIFAGTCNACHKSPRGLLKTVSPGSLPGFLREHYTTSGDMASLLSAYLISNGASDSRVQAKQGTDAKPAGGTEQLDWQGRRLRPQEAARPDADGSPLGQGRAKRQARPGEAPDAAKPAVDGQAPAQSERGPDGRRLTDKQSLSKRSRPGTEEAPNAKDEPPKAEPGMDDKAKAETAKEDIGKPEIAKPDGDGNSEAARLETPRESGGGTPVSRLDPVPQVTPAPPSASATVSSPASEPVADRPAVSAPAEAPVTVSASPPVVSDGPPVPPISK